MLNKPVTDEKWVASTKDALKKERTMLVVIGVLIAAAAAVAMMLVAGLA